jgi:hypothetical protein
MRSLLIPLIDEGGEMILLEADPSYTPGHGTTGSLHRPSIGGSSRTESLLCSVKKQSM